MSRARVFIITLFSALIVFAVFTYAYANNLSEDEPTYWITINSLARKDQTPQVEKDKASAKLPASLSVIEDEAFEGTALTTVDLPDTVQTIGDYSFANIQVLKNITIPNNTTYIGENAFKGSNQVMITAAPKGYARTWAKDNGVPFIPITSFYAFDTPVQITGLSQSRTEQQKLLLGEESTENTTPKPTGRMSGELKADRYEELTAFHIQGRSPPMC